MSAGRNVFSTVILGFALFACFLGAGSLLFAPTVGLMAGREWHLALFSFTLSGILLPALAFAAVARAGGIDAVTSEMGKPFSILFTSIMVLCTSLFIAAPRAAETIHALAVTPIIGSAPPILTSLVFFAAVFFLSSNLSTAVKIIGKYFSPIILLVLSVIIVKAILNPIDIPADTGIPRLLALREGFMDGYRTMSIFAVLIFSGAVFAALGAMEPGSRLARGLMSCGAILVALLTIFFICGGLIYLGAAGSGLLTIGMGEAAILSALVNSRFVLVLAVLLACLSAVSGLTAGASLFFSRATGDKLPYKTGTAVICALSLLVAALGSDVITRYVTQVLTVMYPAVIVLAALNVIRCPLINRGTFLGGVYCALVVSFLDMMFLMGHTTISVEALPFFVHGLAWLAPSAACALLGTIVYYFVGKKGKKGGENEANKQHTV